MWSAAGLTSYEWLVACCVSQEQGPSSKDAMNSPRYGQQLLVRNTQPAGEEPCDQAK